MWVSPLTKIKNRDIFNSGSLGRRLRISHVDEKTGLTWTTGLGTGQSPAYDSVPRLFYWFVAIVSFSHCCVTRWLSTHFSQGYAEILRRDSTNFHRGAPFAESCSCGYLPLWKWTCPGSYHHEPAPRKSPRRTSPIDLAIPSKFSFTWSFYGPCSPLQIKALAVSNVLHVFHVSQKTLREIQKSTKKYNAFWTSYLILTYPGARHQPGSQSAEGEPSRV